MKVKAINPLYLDKAYAAGAVLDIPDTLADKWLELKYIEKVEAEKKTTKKTAAKK